MSANRSASSITPYVVGIIGTLLIIFLVYLLMFMPKLKEAEALNAQTAQIQTSNSALKGRMDLVQAQKDNLPMLTKSVSDFNRSFPAEVDQKDLLEAISRAAGQAGVKLTNVSTAVPASVGAIGQEVGTIQAPAAVPPADSNAAVATPEGGLSGAGLAKDVPQTSLISEPVAQVELTLNAEGERANLRSFLTKLEELRRPVIVQSFELHEIPDSASLTLKGNTLFTAPLTVPAAEG